MQQFAQFVGRSILPNLIGPIPTSPQTDVDIVSRDELATLFARELGYGLS